MNTIRPEVTEPDEEDGLIFACALDGNGSASLIDWSTVEAWNDDGPPIWLHLDRSSQRARNWLRNKSGITPATADALLAEETRPRVFSGQRGLVTVLRGVNLNEGAKKEDMVAIRLWCEGKRVISIRDERLQSARDILAALLDQGIGPRSIPDLYVRLIIRVNERIGPTVDAYEEQIDEIEERLSQNMGHALTTDLMQLRQNAVVLRRYLAPQRLALRELEKNPPQWAGPDWSVRLREGSDQLLRIIEDLDTVRERAVVLKDDVASQLSERTSRTLYWLAIISAIFLPLSFLTGLFGINIGGMPGVKSETAFYLFSGVMLLILVAEVILLRRLKWI